MLDAIASTLLGLVISPAAAAEASNEPEIVAFHVNWDQAARASLEENLPVIDVLIPEWLHLADAVGGLAEDAPQFTEQATELMAERKPDLTVLPLINNYHEGAWRTDLLDAVLWSAWARDQLIAGLLDYVVENDFAGITIGLQGVRPDTAGVFLSFAEELFTVFRANGRQVYHVLSMEDRTVDARVLSDFADAIVVLGDGEEWTREGAGPLASQRWFEAGITRRAAEIPADKLIISLSNMAHDWRPGGKETYSIQEAFSRARDAGVAIGLDPVSLNAKFDYVDMAGIEHSTWMLNGVTAFNHWQVARGLSPRGIALWRLGTEDPTVWTLLANPTGVTPEELLDIQFSHQIDRYGTGEVTRLSGLPTNGHRRIGLSSDRRFIVSEGFDEMPRSFEIVQWGAEDAKLLVLTFDDGPDPTFTPQILDILRTYEVPATFFMVGSQMLHYPEIIERVIAEGHEVGSHTYTHANISRVSDDMLRLELNATQRVFESVTGRNMVLFRAPYARDANPQTAAEIRPLKVISELGYLTVNMNIDSRDWWLPNTDRIVRTTLDGARAGLGNIILLHDAGGNRSHTVAALPQIIEQARAEGFRFVAVSELIGQTRDEIMPVAEASPAIQLLQRAGFSVLRGAEDFLAIAFVAAVVLGIGRSLILVLLSLVRRPARPSGPPINAAHNRLGRRRLSVGVVVPGYNEEKVIVQTVRSLLASEYDGKLRILVVDDGSTDNTYELCRTTFADEPRVEVITKPNGGKSEALNLGFRHLRSDIVVAMDADTIFQPDAISKLVRHFSDPRVAAVSGNAKVGNRVNLLTRWQALEYITAQNLDRRAFELLNCILVVPGAIGAWRRKLVVGAGGFTTDTLAEDADLTMRLLRQGYAVTYEPGAVALTEAPESIRQFNKQRFRWMYGTLQVAFKHLGALRMQDSKSVALIAIPNTLLFQILFPLLAPVADLVAVLSLGTILWDATTASSTATLGNAGLFLMTFSAFIVVDFIAAATAFWHERREDWRLLFWLVPQRFFYRQLIYVVAIRAVTAALRGSAVGWGSLTRTAHVNSQPAR